MTPQEEQEKARWWQRIVFLEPELARSEKARSRIEAVLGLYLGHRANIQKRRSKSPWELNHADAAEMKTRVEQLRREQPRNQRTRTKHNPVHDDEQRARLVPSGAMGVRLPCVPQQH